MNPREHATTASPLVVAPRSRSFIANGCRTVALNAVTANSPLTLLLFILCQLAPKPRRAGECRTTVARKIHLVDWVGDGSERWGVGVDLFTPDPYSHHVPKALRALQLELTETDGAARRLAVAVRLIGPAGSSAD